MGVWTHIAGVVRVDFVPSFGEFSEDDVLALFKVDVPCGSEGCVEVYARKVGDGRSFVWGYVVFLGDLRDFDVGDVPKVVEWIRKSTGRVEDCEGAYVRQGVALIEVEWSEPIVYVYLDGIWVRVGG